MEVAIADAVFLTHWFVSRSVAEVGRRWGEPMKAILATAARLRAEGWPMPYRPLEDTAPRAGRKPVLASLRDDPSCGAWVDGDGATWTPAGKAGRTAECCRCGGAVGPNGYNRLASDDEPGCRSACPKCVTVVSLPADGL